MSKEEKFDIILKLRFRSRKNEWYVENTWAELESVLSDGYEDTDIIEDGSGLFKGWTMETYIGNTKLLPRWDGETCLFNEFDIFYEDGNRVYTQVNKFTIKQLTELVAQKKGD
jgi:hypothetical protein